MKSTFYNIKISGKYYPHNDLAALSNNKIQDEKSLDWEIDFYRFILDWISNSSIVEVKTSGSTGLPKTINLEKEKMIQSALRTGSFLDLKKNDKALLCLPVNFIAGKMMVVRAFVLGLDLYPVKPESNPLKSINDFFDFAAMTPMQVSNILKESDGMKKLNGINKLIIGGGEVSHQLAEQVSTLSNKTWNTYGMTETITHVALKKLNGNDKSDYFKTIPGVSIEKDSRDCIVVNAPHLSEKPLITNDVVYLISKSEFEFIGRYDNVINSGGIKLHPEVIEKKLKPFINQRFVLVGVPDNELGRKAVLAVEGKKDERFLPDYIAAGLSKYEIPKQVFFVEKIPQTFNGKVDRNRLQQIIQKKT